MAADDEVDILVVERGTITAPAGCGKTHLIADALTRHNRAKPVLILTHTNAGVVALRDKLDRLSVPPNTYRVVTIDGWAIRLISMFPRRSGHDPTLLKLANPGTDYPNIRVAAAKLLKAGHVNDVVHASYDRLIVDEYQDCSIRQHAMIAHAAGILPTVVLGDPLQAIFGFGGDPLVAWDDVIKYFPIVGQLNTPWRWINAGAEPLGTWLLEVREKLLRGEAIDLRQAPAAVTWVELDGSDDHAKKIRAARVRLLGNPCVLIIGDSTSPAGQRRFAKQIPGAVTVEAVDLRDLVAFAERFDLDAGDALDQLAQFAENVMVNVGASDFVARVQAMRNGAQDVAVVDAVHVALDFVRRPNYLTAIDVLVELGKLEGVRTHRPAVLRACIKALELCHGTKSVSLHDAAIRMREENRVIGRPLPRRAVGSTLLLKGLEGDAAVILNAEVLNPSNLYVAMTRGSKRLIVCSSSPVLNPH
jgi:AAA domain